ncbi:MAG TPA: IS66 family insertion sequence element accessory protein TnpB [Polyangia bacterium]
MPVIPRGAQIYLGLDPIDLRWGFDRLAGAVAEKIGRDARGGALFVFYGRQRQAIKVLFHDGTGMCLFYKRLDRGLFRIPKPLDGDDTRMEINERELEELLDGIDFEKPARKIRKPTMH